MSVADLDRDKGGFNPWFEIQNKNVKNGKRVRKEKKGVRWEGEVLF